MSAQTGFACGAAGDALDREAPVRAAQRQDGVPTGLEAWRAPWWRRDRRRVITVRAEAVAVRGIRRALCSACEAWGAAELAECVAACASELVTNAIMHARWPADVDRRLRLVVSRSARAMMVEVSDPDSEWPTPRAAVQWATIAWGDGSSAGESGLGLRLVRERVTELGGQLGCVSGPSGKVVFFVLPLPQRYPRGTAVRPGGVAR